MVLPPDYGPLCWADKTANYMETVWTPLGPRRQSQLVWFQREPRACTSASGGDRRTDECPEVNLGQLDGVDSRPSRRTAVLRRPRTAS